MTDDYDERASLTAFRMVLGVPAYIVGAALTPAIVGLFVLKRTGYGALGIIYGILAAAALLIAAAGLRERKKISGGGMYYGVWGLATKVSDALGIAASGWVLQLFGYVPNVAQSAHTLSGIRLFFGPVPAVFFALAL